MDDGIFPGGLVGPDVGKHYGAEVRKDEGI